MEALFDIFNRSGMEIEVEKKKKDGKRKKRKKKADEVTPSTTRCCNGRPHRNDSNKTNDENHWSLEDVVCFATMQWPSSHASTCITCDKHFFSFIYFSP
jgi:hypothetical protein